MALSLLGDMARHFQSVRQGADLRQQLDRLTVAMSAGVAADATAHLSGRADRLVMLDRQIALRTAEHAATRALGQRFETVQVALESLSAAQSTTASDLVALPAMITESQISAAATRADFAFRSAVVALNERHGADSLFAGTATDGPALARADTILVALRSAVSGATSAGELAARVNTFFTDPGGGYMMLGYQGNVGAAATRRVDADLQVTAGPRADDPAIRTVLRGLALAAVAADPGLALTATDSAATLRQAGLDLVGAAAGLADLRGALGAVQQQVDEAASRQSAAVTADRILRNGLVALDPAETATRLTQVQSQLEAHYTVTARLAGLSLAGYLR